MVALSRNLSIVIVFQVPHLCFVKAWRSFNKAIKHHGLGVLHQFMTLLNNRTHDNLHMIKWPKKDFFFVIKRLATTAVMLNPCNFNV